MPVAPTYPGVYVQEISSGLRTISGVATSVAAFVDWFSRGPMDEATQVFSWADIERTFGGLNDRSESSYALQQFFLNGGTTAWIVRVAADDPDAATAELPADPTAATPATVLTVTAANPGSWGNGLRVRVSPYGDGTFDLSVREVAVENGREVVAGEEVYRALDAIAASNDFADAVVDAADGMVTLATTAVPGATGTLSGDLSAVTWAAGAFLAGAAKTMTVTLTTAADSESRDVSLGTDAIDSIEEAAALLQGVLRSSRPGASGGVAGRVEFAQATVTVLGDRLQVAAGCGETCDGVLSFADIGAGSIADELMLSTTATDPAIEGPASYELAGGTDGTPPGADELIGSQATSPPTGLYALDQADLFNLLCLPRVAKVTGSRTSGDDFSAEEVDPVVAAATAYCEARRAVLLLDPPADQTTLPKIRAWLTSKATLRHKNVALYFPQVVVADPNNDYRPRSIGPSGTIAGLCSRTDTERGVWVAPAGTDAVLRGTTKLESKISDAENGQLNPIAVNALRTFDLYGNVAWGARTLFGEDSRGSEWKYLPIRRLALYLEESLFRGTQWVIFEPNDEPLWAQIRLSVGAFMADLFRKGAFQGKTKQEAYFVRCDATTTTPLDQDRGIVNLVVGFAPLKPAEFLVISIQQIASKVEV